LRGRADRPDYVDMLTTVSVPALVVVGTEDEYTPVSVARRMHDLIPGSALAIIEGAAHLPNLERQTGFNQAVQQQVRVSFGQRCVPAHPGPAQVGEIVIHGRHPGLSCAGCHLDI
ncbi:alpha/beta fold hydrolase, partial [Kibdelosporangium lantanae]